MVDNQKVTIFCRSYDGDAKWLEWTLPKMLERGHGYADCVVVGIETQCTAVKAICAKNGVSFLPDTKAAGIPVGYINQQYTKMRADLFCDTEYVMFLDSDVICLEDHTPDIFFRDGKPLLLYTRWEDVGEAQAWREPTCRAIGRDPEYEFMRRLPMVYPTSVIRDCRGFMEMLHGKKLSRYMNTLSCISEFNILGAYAWNFRKDDFTWTNTANNDFTPLPFKQFWSWGNMKKQIEEAGLA